MKESGVSGIGVWHDDCTVEYGHDNAAVHWDEYWSYGGHDSGVDYIPIEALLDDTYEAFITQYVAELVEKAKASEARKLVKQRESAIRDLERQAAKLGKKLV